MDLLQTILALIVTLGVLVTIHEAGHFLVARALGVRVLRFSVGLGPPIAGRRGRDGTEYVIAALPLGGYVRMLDSREGNVPPEQAHAAFDAKPPGTRIAIALAGPAANFLLAVVVYWLVFVTGVSGFAPLLGEVAQDSPAGRAGIEPGSEIVRVEGEPTPTWQAVNTVLIGRLGESGSIEITTRLPGGDATSVHELSIERWLAGEDAPDPLRALGLEPAFLPVIGEVVADSPAEAAGLRVGDRIVAVNGEPVESWTQWVEAVQGAPGEPLELRVDHAGRTRSVTLVPARREGADGGEQGFAGTGAMYRVVRAGPLEAVPQALGETWQKTVLTLELIRKMLTGLVSTRNLSGPITIATVAGDSAASGLESFLGFLALLSVSLGVLNLLPIPVLDGGHVLFYVVELVRGKPVPERVQAWGLQIGLFIVAGLMLLAFYNDLTRL